MFSFFKKSPDKALIKGFKVSLSTDRSKKHGIAANSIKTLRDKIEKKFKISHFNLFLSDGSLLDDEEYFHTLLSQSDIIVAPEGEEIKTDLELAIESFRKVNHDVLSASNLVKEFMRNNDHSDILKVITQLHDEIEKSAALSLRDDDPEWFLGVDTKLCLKEDVMRRKAQDRIRGYFYKTKDELTKSSIYRKSPKGHLIIEDLLSDFFLFLNGVDYFASYFDRKCDKRFLPKVNDETDAISDKPKRRKINPDAKEKVSKSGILKELLVTLCNEAGNFDCHGSWTSSTCNYQHKINPYATRESLLFFQVFNLDHQIEISRSIFPSILKNVELLINKTECQLHKKTAIALSSLTYFREIFTMNNLKLVHIICHNKRSHEALKSNGKVLCNSCNEFKTLQKIKS